MVEPLIMLAQTKVGLASSGAALLGVITAITEGVSQVVPPSTPVIGGQTIGQTAIQFAGVAIITAIGSIFTPIAIEWIRAWSAAKKAQADAQAKVDEARLQADQREKENEFEKRIAVLQEKAERFDRVEAEARVAKEEAWQAKIAAEGYRVRLELLEGRALATTKAIENVSAKVAQNTGGIMAPTAAIVTDAYGKIISVTGQLEFILHYKPEEVIGMDIYKIIPTRLHPDPIHHEERSFNPSIDFHDKTFRAVSAITKEGQAVDVDILLTRWFEKGQRGSITGVRFGKVIKKHIPGPPETFQPFPPAESVLPGFNRDIATELAKNTETVSVNTEKLAEANEKLDKIIK